MSLHVWMSVCVFMYVRARARACAGVRALVYVRALVRGCALECVSTRLPVCWRLLA